MEKDGPLHGRKTNEKIKTAKWGKSHQKNIKKKMMRLKKVQWKKEDCTKAIRTFMGPNRNWLWFWFIFYLDNELIKIIDLKNRDKRHYFGLRYILIYE